MTFQRRIGVKYVSRAGIIDIKAMCKILNGVINNNSGAQKKNQRKRRDHSSWKDVLKEVYLHYLYMLRSES